MASRNHAIDSLRTISVLYIVGYLHLLNYVHGLSGYTNIYTYGISGIVLGVFTFTSGYLLANRPVNLEFTDILTFYRRRLIRIYPLYAITVLLFMWAGIINKTIAIKAILLISMFNQPAPPTLWFITMLVIFYLVAPLLIYFAKQPLKFLAICGVLMIALIAFSILLNPVDKRMFMYFPTFAIGVMIARHVKMKLLIRNQRFILLLMLIPAFMGFYFGNQLGLPPFIAFMPLIAVGSTVLFVYIEYYMGNWQNTIVRQISYASFCMYLLHRLIYQYSVMLYLPDTPWMQVAYLLIFGLSITILISYVVQYNYDRLITRIR